jgi:hypothetical protein
MKKDLTFLNTNEILDAEFTKPSLVELGIYHNSHWILPQILAKLSLVRPQKSAEGDYKFSDLFQLWKTQQFLDITSIRAWLKILNHPVRGEVLNLKQSSDLGSRYSQGVPLLLSAHKQFNKIDYSKWDYSDLVAPHMVPQDILDCYKYVNIFSHDELLEFRETSLLIKTGKQAGTFRTPEACTKAYAITDTRFLELPKLVKLQVLDLWIYHPEIRNSHLFWIGDNPDQPPIPLLTQEVISTKQKSTVPELDWG